MPLRLVRPSTYHCSAEAIPPGRASEDKEDGTCREPAGSPHRGSGLPQRQVPVWSSSSGPSMPSTNILAAALFLADAIVQFACDAAPLLVLQLHQAPRHAAQLFIQRFQLPRPAVQLREHADFSAQQLRNDWDRNVIYRPTLVSLQPVQVGEVDGRDEDDGGLAEPWMLANHVGQLEAIEFGHTYVHQHDGDVGFEEMFKGLAS